MSNVAYYFDNAANKSQNDRMTDFINELNADVRFPYHAPKITTAGNFTPAAFSYAKHFYVDELRDFALDRFELAKVIQQDIAEEAVTNRQVYWTSSEFDSFRKFVQELPDAEREVILGMAGYFSLRGRGRLLLKWLKRRVMTRIPAPLQVWGAAVWGRKVDSKYPWTIKVDVGDVGITNGHDLMKHFSAIVKTSDECSEGKNESLSRLPGFSQRGQLHISTARN